jgi:hypothetical protein
MLQEYSGIPHFLGQNLWPSVAGILAIGGFITGWFSRRKREPVEIGKLRAETSKLDAETRGIDATTRSTDANTNQVLLATACEALTKASRLLDEKNHWQRKAGDLLRRAVQAEAEAAAAQMFVDQLHAAARLTVCEHHPSGVRLADFSPRELNPPKQ